MKKLLYITVNSKPQQESTSKTAGREFINRFLEANKDYTLEELDLYNAEIPEVNHKLFTGRAEIVSGTAYDALSQEEKKQVDIINSLCDQFVNADTYVFAVPMWSISYPSRLKRYIDCIIINNKTIKIGNEEVKGLLDSKERNMVYIQSSGGVYPKIFSGKFDHGIDYFHDLFEFLGIKKFEKILIEGVEESSIGKEEALHKAYKEMDSVINRLSRELVLSF